MDTCRTARLTWPNYDLVRTNSLLSRSRRDVSRLTAVLTGHWLIGRHGIRLGIVRGSHCRSCGIPGEEETVEHLLCDCPALQNIRLRILGDHILDDLSVISRVGFGDLIRYLNRTRWV